MSPLIRRLAPLTAVVALLLGTGGIYLGMGPYLHYNDTDPASDGFVQPRSIEALVDRVSASTVTVFCDYSKEKTSLGSGWAIELPNIDSAKYKTTIITNHHVIKKCLGYNSKVFIKLVGSKKRYEAVVENWDKENDLAVIVTTMV
jgi:S1-C subfamily serine protease